MNDTTRDDLYVFEVYGDPGVVKIGRSLNVPRRFISIQCSCPYELWLRARIFGGGGLEPFLHEMFSRSRMRGEWFRLDEERLDRLDSFISAANGVLYERFTHFEPEPEDFDDLDLPVAPWT